MLANGPGACKRPLVLVCGLLLLLWAAAALVWPPGEDLPRYVALFLLAWASWAAALALVVALPSDRRALDLAFIFGVGLLLRVAFLFTSPTLSDDIFRSVWDARVMSAGINPYLYSPGAEELAWLRDESIWPRINHPHQRTPYPPLSEALNWAVYRLGPERLLPFQVLAAGSDLLAAALLAWLLQRTGADPRRALALAWSPAGAVHFAHSGHNDAAMIATLVGAALLLSYGRGWLAMLALAASTMIKAVPALAVPAFGRMTGWTGLVAWGLGGAAVAFPFAAAGPGLISGVVEEGSAAQFNDSLHFLLQRLAWWRLGEEIGALVTAAVTAALALAAAALIAATMERTAQGALAAASRALGAFILLAPAVQPWYAPWVAPLIALGLEPGRGLLRGRSLEALAWTWFTGAVALTELTYAPGGAALWPVVRLVEYGPLYALLGLAVWTAVSTGPQRRPREARGRSE